MIGKTISHYKILEKLGEGGMGVVYKAQDTKLKRPVALKFLPPELTRDKDAKERFINEAQAASALDHVNICAIHEIDETEEGQMHIVMACYEGEILKDKIERSPLKLEEAIDIAIQIAKGLEKAHKKEIVHRDIKPGNIFITHDGIVKIVDFGLAKLKGQVKLTKEGTTLGTAAYMSPENTRSSVVDHRTDIWSLGIVLYEMLTGQLPFRGEYEQAVTYSILNEEPDPVTAMRTGIPMELERIINKCLAKEPERRYQQIQEVIVDLKEIKERHDLQKKTVKKQLTTQKSKVPLIAAVAVVFVLVVLAGVYFFTGQADRIDSIAVLPLDNRMGEGQEKVDLVDNMHEKITTELSQIGALDVRSHYTTKLYNPKEIDKTIPEIAGDLNVDVILVGSVSQEEENISIAVQLIDGKTDKYLWENSFDRKLVNVLNLPNDVARAVVDQIKVVLTPEEEERLETTLSDVNPEALRYYLEGWRYRLEETPESVQNAMEYLEEAVTLDSSFALAWANLVIVYSLNEDWNDLDSTEAFIRASHALEKALALNPDLPEVYINQGLLIYYLGNNNITTASRWDEAEAAFRHAIKLNPGLVDARYEYGYYLLRSARYDEAISNFQKAQELSPYSFHSYKGLYWTYRTMGQFEKAYDYTLMGQITVPSYTNFRSYLAMSRILMLYQQKHYGQLLEEASVFAEDFDISISRWGNVGMMLAYRSLNEYDRATAIFNSQMIDPYWQVRMHDLYTWYGDYESALDWLEERFTEISLGQKRFFITNINGMLWELHDNPRFQALVAQTGLKY